MTPDLNGLATVVTAELAVALAMLLCYLGFASRRLFEREPARARALQALLGALQAAGPPRAPAELLRLDRRSRLRVVLRAAPTAMGDHLERLRRIAAEAGLAADADRASRSVLWWRRLEAVRLCAALGSRKVAMRRLLADPVVAVRAQAVEWALCDPEPSTIDTLLSLLDDREALCRFAVQDTLIRMGPAVTPSLARYLHGRDGPHAVTGLRIATAIADPDIAPELPRFVDDPDPHCRAAALGAVGAIGGADATAAVDAALLDAEPLVREAAARTAAVLGHWAAAPAIAFLLRDGTWEVRRAAGYALRSFGAIGQLYLRRALGDSDRFAADMAHQLLDLSATN